MSSNTQAQGSAAAALAKFEAKLKSEIHRVEKIAQHGLSKIAAEVEAHSTSEKALLTALRSALDSAVDSQHWQQIIKRFLPFSQASAKLIQRFTAWGSDDDLTAVDSLIFISIFASKFAQYYGIFAGECIAHYGSDSIPIQDLKTILVPMRLVSLGSSIVLKAWQDFERALAPSAPAGIRFNVVKPHAVESVMHLMQGFDYSMVSLENLAVILRRRQGVTVGDLGRLKSVGIDFWSTREHWETFNRLVAVLHNPRFIGGRVLAGDNNIVQKELAIAFQKLYADYFNGLFAVLEVEALLGDSTSHHIKQSIFFSKNHIQSMIMALEGVAVYAADDWKNMGKNDEIILSHVLAACDQLISQNTGEEEAAAFPGGLEALQYACSPIPHSRVYNACQTIYEAALKLEEKSKRRAECLLVVSTVLTMWGYMTAVPPLKMDGSWLAVDGTGEMPKLKLRCQHLEALLNNRMIMAKIVKNDSFAPGRDCVMLPLPWIITQHVTAVVTIGEGLWGDSARQFKAWQYARPCIVAGLKAAQAFNAVPAEKWLSLPLLMGADNATGRQADVTKYQADNIAATMATVRLFRVLASSAQKKEVAQDTTAIALWMLDIFDHAHAPEETKAFIAAKGNFPIFFNPLIAGSSVLSNIVPASTYFPSLESFFRMINQYEAYLAELEDDPQSAAQVEDLERFRGHCAEVKPFITGWLESTVTAECSAVARAKVLGAALPCACFSCTTIRPVGGTKTPIGGPKRCSGCRTVVYCSSACQKKDWKVHKVACKAIAKRLEAGGA